MKKKMKQEYVKIVEMNHAQSVKPPVIYVVVKHVMNVIQAVKGVGNSYVKHVQVNAKIVKNIIVKIVYRNINVQMMNYLNVKIVAANMKIMMKWQHVIPVVVIYVKIAEFYVMIVENQYVINV